SRGPASVALFLASAFQVYLLPRLPHFFSLRSTHWIQKGGSEKVTFFLARFLVFPASRLHRITLCDLRDGNVPPRFIAGDALIAGGLEHDHRGARLRAGRS